MRAEGRVFRALSPLPTAQQPLGPRPSSLGPRPSALGPWSRTTIPALMRVTFLGTGTSTGVPVVGCRCAVCTSDDPRNQRLRQSVKIEMQGKVFLIDTTPDLRLQLLRDPIPRLD